MAWKNLKQRSLADSMIVDHDAVKELDELNALIDWFRWKVCYRVFMRSLEVRKPGPRC